MEKLNKKNLTYKYKNTVSSLDRIADLVAKWTGSWTFLLLHLLWFGLWLWYRLNINALTLIVSLEAIILMNVLLMAQNRQNEASEKRVEADYQIDAKSAKDIEEVKELVKKIQKKF